ncbi:MAG TPA: Ig-like domain repeat protein [Verrucomicrobiae bacterium]|nr:Ig-like domain repeat protein [Verrucomicrobiae bacterium]
MRAIPVHSYSSTRSTFSIFSCEPALSATAVVLVAATLLFATVFAVPVFAQQSGAQSTVTPLITQTIDESKLTALKGNTYFLAQPQYDLGAAPASLPMERMLLVLKRSPQQESALLRLLDEQQDKSSASYHQWLTPEEFGKQFGPTDADMQTITSWLQSHGFQVGTSKGRTVLEFSGSASQVQEAFHTAIHKYVINGQQHWANAGDPQIPTALAPAVAGIDSLNNFQRKAMNRFVGIYSKNTRQLTTPSPNYTFPCQGGDCYGIVPYDFATIYDVQSLWTAGINGSGQTIAIVGRTNINPSDPATFWSLFGLSVPSNKLNIILNGTDPGINGDEAEADIDVQWSGAVAPQATIDFVTSASTDTTDGVDLSALYIIENNLAPVMSESYGECELGLGTAGNSFYNAIWEQASAQGISVFVSSGDNGAAGCDDPNSPADFGLNVNGLASTPFNAAIGGTDFNQYNKWSTYWNSTNDTHFASAKSYIPETTWDDSCTNPLAITLGFGTTAEQACNNSQMLAEGGVNSTGGSGGPSNCAVNTQGVLGSCTAAYAKPTWQTGTGITDNRRDLPDVSLFASNGFLGSFYVICLSDVTGGVCDQNDFAGYGGTSVSSPAFAGIMSLVDEKTGAAQGVPGFALYQLASKQSSAFHDVPNGSTIAMPCFTGSANCVTNTVGDSFGVLSGYATSSGYDLATGLGTVDAANLVNNWTKATFTSTTTTLQLNNGNAVSVTHGSAVPVNITLNHTAATGAAALLVDVGPGTTTGKSIDAFSLSSGAFSGTTSLLPGGTYNVIAHYGGDGTYGGSYSNTVSVTVNKENSTVAFGGLTESGDVVTTTVGYDYFYWMRVDVQNSQAQYCDPLAEIACPTGTVTLTDNGNALGTYTINTEGSVLTPPESIVLTGGTHNLVASYSGDSSYNAGTKSVTVTVNKASTNTSAPSTSGAATIGQQVSLTSLVQDPNSVPGVDAVPSGTVTFYANGTALPGTVTYTNGGGAFFGLYATLNATFSTPGSYNLTATYSGDQNYSTSTSTATPLSVQYPQPALMLTPASQTVNSGDQATVTALVDSSNKTTYPTGSVTFVNAQTQAVVAGPTTCVNAKDGSGNYACSVSGTFTVTSTMSVYAQYSGDTNYPTSTSGAATISVPDFSMAPQNTQVTSTQGQNPAATMAINLTALNGFNGAVSSFACSGLPAEASCSFSPTSVTGTGSTTMTITTAAVGQGRRAFLRRASVEPRREGWLAIAMLPLVGVFLIGIPAWRRKGGTMLVLLMVATLVVLPSCGGGNSGGGQQNNPVPAISSLSPVQQAAGSAAQTLTISGSGFISSSTVTFNGVSHLATYSSASQLSIGLTTGDLATQGSYGVIVTNPAPGGGASNSSAFTVTSGTPTGAYTVTVTATSGALTHNTTFTLIVQ